MWEGVSHPTNGESLVNRCRKWHRSQKPTVEIRFVRVKPAFLNGMHKKSERELNGDFEGRYNRLIYS